MNKRKKLKFKKFHFHPVTSYILLIFIVIILSGILSLFDFQSTYNVIQEGSTKLESVTSVVYNLFSFEGIKYIISNAAYNFISFAPLSMYLLAALGIATAEASGFLDLLFKRIFDKLNNRALTFIVIFIATISSLINEVGFVILIPISAIIYKSKGRNPLGGICAAFAGAAFGYGTSIFVGSIDVLMIPYTTIGAWLVDTTTHISLTSNLFIMIASSVILSIVGTVVIEKIIIPRLGMRFEKKESAEILDFDDESALEQTKLSEEYNEKKGFRCAIIVSIIFVLFVIYSLIPGFPFSGLLLDLSQETYLNKLFGPNEYFEDSFTFIVSLWLLLSSLAYGIASKKFNGDKSIIDACQEKLRNVGEMLLLLFVAAQFIAIFKKTNIGNIISGDLANILGNLDFGGIFFLILAVIFIMISDIFTTGIQAKWMIFAPCIVPVLMRSNVSPQFTQFAMRAADSMANGITPLYAYFVIFIGYMNIYNSHKEKPIGVMAGIKLMMPYFIIISITWLLILIGWYIIGLPIGPNVYTTI